MFQDTYTHTEKFHSWDRADRRGSMHTRRRRIPHRGVIGSSHDNNATLRNRCSSGRSFRLPLQVFTDPKFVATIPHMEEEE